MSVTSRISLSDYRAPSMLLAIDALTTARQGAMTRLIGLMMHESSHYAAQQAEMLAFQSMDAAIRQLEGSDASSG